MRETDCRLSQRVQRVTREISKRKMRDRNRAREAWRKVELIS